MANLAASAVTVLDWWSEGGPNGKRHIAKRVTLVLTGQGSTANLIPTTVFGPGIRTLVRATSFVKSDNSVVVNAGVKVDGSALLLLLDGSDAPADVTGTFTGVVIGY